MNSHIQGAAAHPLPTYTLQPLATDRYPLSVFAVLLELALVMLAAHEAYWLHFDTWHLPARYLTVALVTAFTAVLLQSLAGAYASWRGRHFGGQLLRVFIAWCVTAGILALASVALKLSANYSRLWFGTMLVLGLAQTSLVRILWASVLHFARAQGRNLKRIVLIESGSRGTHPIENRLHDLHNQGYRVAGRVRTQTGADWLDQLEEQVAEHHAREVWICLPLAEGELVKPIAQALRNQTVDIRFLPALGDIPLLNYRIRSLIGLPAVDISCSPMTGTNRVIKRALDLMLGALISILILPLCALIALAVRLDSRGPALFVQTRLGMNGQTIKVLKFRSMKLHHEPDGQVTQAQYGDTRITRVGAFLRRTSLDELPQFWNVLRGDMSIVGPRPHALAHNAYYRELVHSYMKRHKVKPGITGWAQVNGYRGITDTVDKMEKRVEYDLWYINHWSLWLDLKIIAGTVVRGFGNGAP